ncbi:MAG: aminotransferase class V-fold PLP-dependent enzyme [Microbacterium sp.]|nr:aminotransferase class V-fold PLP-dependent enzyme [Microbacterium sp.]
MTDLESFAASFDAEPGYLDWAAFGPLSRAVRAEALADLEMLGTGRPSGIELVATHVDDARELLADLLDADAEEVVLAPSAAHAVFPALCGISGGLLVSRTDAPALTVAAVRAEAVMGRLRVEWMEPPHGFVSPDAVREALTAETAAVAVSLVDPRTGYVADLNALREVIGDRLLIVDDTQGFGVTDVAHEAADVVFGAGSTWLRAGRGTGCGRFGARAVERISPVLGGGAWVAAEASSDPQAEPGASAQAFAAPAADELAAARLAAALDEVGAVGVSEIARTVAERCEEVMFYADRYDIPVVTPRDPVHRAGIVALEPVPADVGPLGAALANHGVTFTARSGLIRLSPHVGTGEDTMQMLGDALAAFAAARVW